MRIIYARITTLAVMGALVGIPAVASAELPGEEAAGVRTPVAAGADVEPLVLRNQSASTAPQGVLPGLVLRGASDTDDESRALRAVVKLSELPFAISRAGIIRWEFLSPENKTVAKLAATPAYQGGRIVVKAKLTF